MRIGKIESAILKALSIKRTHEYRQYPPEGNNQEGIAKLVYGEEVMNCETKGGHYCSDLQMTYASRSAISRALKLLIRKGLVMKLKPIYRKHWIKKGEYDGDDEIGFYSRHLEGLDEVAYGYDSAKYIRLPRYTQLPRNTKFWFMLTDEGKELVKVKYNNLTFREE